MQLGDLGEALRATGKKLTEQQIQVVVSRAESECGAALSFDQFEAMLAAASEIEQYEIPSCPCYL
jgi:hypothetical protein